MEVHMKGESSAAFVEPTKTAVNRPPNLPSPCIEGENDDDNTLTHTCPVCGKSFSCSSSMLRHMRNIHQEDTSNMSTRRTLICPSCPTDAYTSYKQLQHHIENQHGITIQTEMLHFNSLEEVQSWKADMEKETRSFYVVGGPEKQMSNGFVKKTFYCNRSGHFSPSGTGQRHMKIQGSRKLNANCPSRIIISKSSSEETVLVEFVKTHYGHVCDLAHTTLQKSQRLAVASDLMNGITPGAILEKVQAMPIHDVKRQHLLTKHDIHNIKRDFKVNSEVKDPNDLTSVEMWVNEMQSLKTSNPVLFFKQQHCSDDNYGLKNDDFVLVLMTEGQKFMLLKHASDCICIDSTHGTNSYGFELTTLLIRDENLEGFPVAFLFSNRQTENIFKLFVSVIKEHVGVVITKTFMSDIAEGYYNAWTHVMGKVANRLYCSWHVVRAWQKNLNLINGKEKRDLVYRQLKCIQMELCKTAFHRALDTVKKNLESDPDTLRFGKYFVDTYCSKVETWAYCYRDGLHINTNMAIERFHGLLKYEHLNGKKVKRLDKGIHALMKYLREKESARLVTLHKGKVSKKLQEIRSRHKKSTEMCKDKEYVYEGSDMWFVHSESADGVMYEVNLNQNYKQNCPCSLKCLPCNSCIHQFTCTCHDFCIKFNMCKHIHLVCMYKKENLPTETDDVLEYNLEIDENFLRETEVAVYLNDLGKGNAALGQEGNLDVTANIEMLKNECNRLIQLCSTPEHITCFKEAIKSLEPKLLTISSMKKRCDNLSYNHEKPSDKVLRESTTNIKKQRFISTRKAFKKKLKVTAPNCKECNNVMNNLLLN